MLIAIAAILSGRASAQVVMQRNLSLAMAKTISELDRLRFICPELLLVTHLLRPGPSAALAAIELVMARGPDGSDVFEVVRFHSPAGGAHEPTPAANR